jgi:hypothetical protein
MNADGGGGAADQEIRVWALAAEDRVQSRDLALPGKRIKVVRYGHQVGFRRQCVPGMAPVGVRENAELS